MSPRPPPSDAAPMPSTAQRALLVSAPLAFAALLRLHPTGGDDFAVLVSDEPDRLARRATTEPRRRTTRSTGCCWSARARGRAGGGSARRRARGRGRRDARRGRRRHVPRAGGGRADAVLRPRLRLLVGRADRLLRGGGPGVRVGDELRGLRRAATSSIRRARSAAGRCSTSTSCSTRSSAGGARSPTRAGARAPSCARSRCRPRTRSCGCWATSRAPRTSSPPCGRAARSRCVTGAPPVYRGEPMVDGGLLEAIPYRTALREGATHVLVLRDPARRATAAAAQDRFAERVLARAHPELAPLLHTCSRALQPRRRRAPAAVRATAARAAGRRAARQPPGVALQHRPRPHRRQRAGSGARTMAVLALRRAGHRVLAALPRAAG